MLRLAHFGSEGVPASASMQLQFGLTVGPVGSLHGTLCKLCRPRVRDVRASRHTHLKNIREHGEGRTGQHGHRRLLERLQSLLDTTFLRRRSCDRKGRMPGRLKLREAFVASGASRAKLWDKYLERRASIAARNPLGCPTLEPPVRTQRFRDLGEDPRVNECYLFHGTSMTSAGQILREGFLMDLAGQSTQARFGPRRKCMFAQGIYFSECASKADEYASDQGVLGDVGLRSSGRRVQLFPMLLCRVVLGRVLGAQRALSDTSDPDSLRKKLKLEHCSSLVGDLEKQCGTYREFVLPQVDQVFPEYLLLYRRLYG